MPIYLYPLIYSISILVGLFNFKKFSHNKPLKFFLYFLIYTLVSEIIGAYMGKILVVKNNVIYNSWNIINMLFVSYLLLSQITNKFKRIIIYLLVAIFIIITFVNVLFYAGIFEYLLSKNNLLAKTLVVVVVIIYFTEVLENDKILNFKNSLFFWIALGIFLYNIAFLPSIALFKYTSVYGMFQYITFGLNLIMHTCFITGFIISKKEFNS
ncbi:hypothetical protein [uncultured Lutibacter sp.]|uniref:hypothetical protein n=1 Tax=uncultured Lutibacter sp. TaxID=437739 RepID=UPI00263715A3|nr:hypothetical protein [uncultured Lutibacter sp.]